MGSIGDLRPITYLKLHRNCLRAWTNKSWVNSWHRTNCTKTSLLNSWWLPRYFPEHSTITTPCLQSTMKILNSPICFFESLSCLKRNLASDCGVFSKKPFSSKYFKPLSGCKLNCLTPWRRILKSLNVTLDQETFLSIPARSIINFPQFEMSLMQYPGSPITTLKFH